MGRHINDLLQAMFDEYGGVMMIDWLHAMIHAGLVWMVTGQTTLASGAVKSFLLTTSADQHTHLTLPGMFRSTGEANLMIYKAPPDASGGTAAKTVNMNDEHSADAPAVTVLEDLVLTDRGTDVLYEGHFGNGQNVGGTPNGRHELELNVSSVYLIVCESEAAANDVSWDLNMYEPKAS